MRESDTESVAIVYPGYLDLGFSPEQHEWLDGVCNGDNFNKVMTRRRRHRLPELGFHRQPCLPNSPPGLAV